MSELKKTRRRLITALIVLLCISLVCGVILLSPIGYSARHGQQQLAAIWNDVQSTTRDTLPLRNIDQEVKQASTQIDQFYADRLPERFANVPDELGKLASENGIRIEAARYNTEDTSLPGLRRVTVQATFSGNYVGEVKFINAVERSKTFFIIDSVSLGEQQGGNVRLQIQMETYVRSQSA